MPDIPNRRRQYIVNKVFQYKLIYSLAGLVILTVVVSHILALGAANLLGTGQGPRQLAQAVQGSLQRGLTWDVIWIAALTTMLIGIVLVLVFGRQYSNRIAGPLFSLKRVLARVGGGDLGTVMHIRTTDEFHDVEDAFNQMMLGLNQRLDLLLKAVQELPEPQRSKLQNRLNEAFFRPEAEKHNPNSTRA